MDNSNVNELLVEERNKCTFDITELTQFLDGGADKTAQRKQIEAFFLSDPRLQDSVPVDYLSHKEKYEQSLRKICVVLEKLNTIKGIDHTDTTSIKNLLNGIDFAAVKDIHPLAVHYAMFMPAIKAQGTQEQIDKWVYGINFGNIIGTYAQTELGHGTFIRGLETRADYNPETQEFVLNSPTLSSYKWWPGGLGHTANFAVVMAQLYSQGKCHGIHSFVVQLRDRQTHEPLLGIKIGEIGTKLGMNSTNNGFLAFKDVRIPRTSLLMKNSHVKEDGTYVKTGNSLLLYGTMVYVRVFLIKDMATFLSKAVTIATRYSAVRRQSELKPGGPECQIINYVTQQNKLFSNLATCYAIRAISEWLWEVYNKSMEEFERGELGSLPELHALSCSMKVISTMDATTGIEICRLACGGHGYMNSSNLPALYGLATAACTYEGENTVLLLQAARYLLKLWSQVQSNVPIPASFSYLQEIASRKVHPVLTNSVPSIIYSLQIVAVEKIRLAYIHMEGRVQKGKALHEAWNETSIELVQAAEAHSRAFIVEKMYEWFEKRKAQLSPGLQTVLCQLVELYAVQTAIRELGNLIRFASVNDTVIENLQGWLERLLAAIRPNAIGLVDAFDYSDSVLGSTLGAYDGRVYERLFEEALKSPLNQEPVNRSFHAYLKPLLKSNI